jgi:hypothetical protein
MSHTPVNIWALVSQASPFREAVLASFGGSSFKKFPSADKIFIWELSKLGSIAVGRHISLFYRRHNEAEMESVASISLIDAEETDFRLTMHIADEAMALGIDALDDWRKMYANAVSVYGLANYVHPWSSALRNLLVAGNRSDSDDASSRSEQSKGSGAKKYLSAILYLITPPLFAWGLGKIRSLARKEQSI